MRFERLSLSLLTLTLLLAGCAAPVDSGATALALTPEMTTISELPPADQVTPEPPDANLREGCISAYAPGVDYFPEEVTPHYASGFTVEYFDSYKLVTLPAGWPGGPSFQYLLVQCGAPIPQDYPDATVVEVPVENIAALSTTYIPMLDAIGALDQLVAVDDFSYVNHPQVRARIAAGDLVEIAPGSIANVEATLELDPALIMAFSSGSPEYDVHPALIEAGLPVVINADWLEATPLGRAEWLKFIALFFNREAEAEAAFAEIEADYLEASTLASSVDALPTVFNSLPYQGTWYMPGGQSFHAALMRDAGAQYVFADDPSTGSLFLDFEAVFEAARDADFWIDLNGFGSLADLAAADPRFAEFAAFQNGQVYGYDARQTEYGNDYFESSAARPDLLLRDLVKIFHPQLLPDHELYYYRQLEAQ